MTMFTMTPLDMVIEPLAHDPLEFEGILNPAAAVGPDGSLYLLARVVARRNFSRIRVLKVIYDADGEPIGVDRVAMALEPEMTYEQRGPNAGGCEDPRVSYVEPLGAYVMTYTAFSPVGPRIALAISKDLMNWTRLGLATFVPHNDLEFNGVDNKDAASFPQAIPNPSRDLELAILHRPLFDGTGPEDTVEQDGDRDVDLHRESIWISYSSLALAGDDPRQLSHFTSHHRLATPVAPWEILKIGSGTPPIMSRHGWMIVYHGVSDDPDPHSDDHQLTYSAGVMILDAQDPRQLRYRSILPVLVPTTAPHASGDGAHVVFPTGIVRRDDIGYPDRYDVYYGIDDYCIGVARLDVPENLPASSPADKPS